MKRQLPLPTIGNPFAQVEYLFRLVAETKHASSTKSNYVGGLNFYKDFLSVTHNYNADLEKNKLVYLDRHFDERVLTNLKYYLDKNNKKGTEGYLTSSTVNGYFSVIRQVFNYALKMNLLSVNSILPVTISDVERETDINTSYSSNEMDQIQSALKEELEFVYKFYRRGGYRKTGVGQNPISIRSGWSSIENIRWYFENVLECDPIKATPENVKKHNGYFRYAPTKFLKDIGGLRGLYRNWGVSQLVDTDLIVPLVIKLTELTGLNVDSILNLKIDCFEQKNKFSGVPVLKYHKVRSNGDKEMHLDSNAEVEEFKEFRQDQIKQIKNIITVILSVTSYVRELAPVELSENLFLIQSRKKNYGKIIKLTSYLTSLWCKKFAEKYQLKNDMNEPLQFNLQRFRPTRATDLVQKGIDLVELQSEMGHSSILTTIGYVDKHKLNKAANEETSNAIENIHNNILWSKSNEIMYINDKKDIKENTLFKSVLCDCKNPYLPPEAVRLLNSYNEGDVCSRVNMCLFCENVMIFKRNLPTLWMYKLQIDRTLDMQTVDLPHHSLYLKTLDVIEQIFNLKISEFSEKDLCEAKELALNLDEYIDPITFQASDEEE